MKARKFGCIIPEIMDMAMTLVTDADGDQFLIDKDGMSIPISNEEDET